MIDTQIIIKLIQHIFLTYTALLVSIIISIPLAVISIYYKKLAKVILLISNFGQSIPSFAVLALVVPLIGLGLQGAIIAILIRAMLPIIKNTYTGLLEVDERVIDYTRGMGLTRFEILWKVRFPNAVPEIFSGIKFAAIMANSIAVIAALIGAPGLGTIIFTGLAQLNVEKLLLGAIPAMLLAVFMEVTLSILQDELTPVNLKS